MYDTYEVIDGQRPMHPSGIISLSGALLGEII